MNENDKPVLCWCLNKMLHIFVGWGFLSDLSAFQTSYTESRDFWGSGNFSQTTVLVVDYIQVKYSNLSKKLYVVKKSCMSISDIRWDNKSDQCHSWMFCSYIWYLLPESNNFTSCGLIMAKIMLEQKLNVSCPHSFVTFLLLKWEVPHWKHHRHFTIVVQYLLLLAAIVRQNSQIVAWLRLHTEGNSCVSDGLGYQRECWVGTSSEFLRLSEDALAFTCHRLTNRLSIAHPS